MTVNFLQLCPAGLVAKLSTQQSLFPQNNTWNATFELSLNRLPLQIHPMMLRTTSEWRSSPRGPTRRAAIPSPFHSTILPEDYDADNPPPPGTPIKIEQYANVTLRTMPKSIAMSRMLYMTETLKRSSLPASAYVLWPYMSRHLPNPTRYSGNDEYDDSSLFPPFELAQGTSGYNQACAPSNLRALWGDTSTTFPLVLGGYAVIAPDSRARYSQSDKSYFVLPSQANDLFRTIEAAQKTWPHFLSKEFVVCGQSQGGAVSWAGAHWQAVNPVDGYLGTIAASPFPSPSEAIAAENAAQVDGRILAIAQGMSSVYPGFQLSEWLPDATIDRLHLLEEANACDPAAGVLFGAEEGEVQFLKDGWNYTKPALWYSNVSTMEADPSLSPCSSSWAPKTAMRTSLR